MKLSELRDLFDGKINHSSFRNHIRTEVSEFQKRGLVKGRSRAISVINDTEIIVSPEDVSRLCSAYLQGDFGEKELAYVADALLLSNSAQDVAFIGDGLAELVGQLTDPEINGPITRERVLDVLTKLALLG